jgi:hypothetical protein
MKTFFKFLALTSSVFAYSQQTQSVNQAMGYEFLPTKSVTSNGKTLKYEDIKGSPYIDTSFKMAKIAENYEEVPIRYNNYKDEIEFKKGEDIQVLPKKAEFSKITIKSPQTTIVYLETNDELKGYFTQLVLGKTSLLRKDKTIFKDEVLAPNSYAEGKPAEFRSQDPVYYIETGSSYIKKPKNQKDIIGAFPNLKDKINTFVKENKIKFNKEEDLKKLVVFLNQN